MINKEIARVLYDISEVLKLRNVQWKPQAYNKAARVIEDLEKDLKGIYEEKGLQGLVEMMNITGIGPKRAQLLFKKLKIKSIADLEMAVKKHKIEKLERFGEKSEKDIKEEIEFFKKRNKNRMLLGDALDLAEKITGKLKAKKIMICGSIRRMYETIGDIDILAVADENLVDDFCKLADRVL